MTTPSAVIARVKAMHKRRTERHGSGCVHCGIVWPCPTFRELDAATATIPDHTVNEEQPAMDRADVLREAAEIAESLRQFEPAYGARKSAQVSENVGILRVADELRRRAGEADGAKEPAAVDSKTFCSFGEGEAPGSGCILLAGHEPASRHVVTPADVDLDD